VDILRDMPADRCPEDLMPAIDAMCRVAKDVARLIALGGIESKLAEAVGDNFGGDQQKALDVIADDAFAEALKGSGVRWYASEEQDVVVEIDTDGTLGLAIDPLDGSSNIDCNVSIGTIWGISPAADNGEDTFLVAGKNLRAAGYFIYGPQTALVVTFGDGVMEFILDPRDGVFKLVNDRMQIKDDSVEFAINASNYRHWPKPVRAYVDDCLAGTEGPRERNFNMRWVASLVAETHRIISRGGIFLYPGDDRKGYAQGRLRMIYECAPIAMLVEQAGGRATNGLDRILDRSVSELHARTPFVFGTVDKVDRVAAYYDLPEHEVSALFGSRGLFRT